MEWQSVIVATIQFVATGLVAVYLAAIAAKKEIERNKLHDDAKATEIFQNIAAKSGQVQLDAQSIIRQQQDQIAELTRSIGDANRQIENATLNLTEAHNTICSMQAKITELERQHGDDTDHMVDHFKKIGVLQGALNNATSKNSVLTAENEMLKRYSEEVRELREELYKLKSYLNELIEELNCYRVKDKKEPIKKLATII